LSTENDWGMEEGGDDDYETPGGNMLDDLNELINVRSHRY
jgi:hypothetical protein